MEKWSRLPTELLFLISDRLGLSDLLRFGAVCRSWRSAIDERRRLRLSHLQVPWLWLKATTTTTTTTTTTKGGKAGKGGKGGKRKRSKGSRGSKGIKRGFQFYRPGEFDGDCRFYSFITQPEQETNCIGSGYGWLVVAYKTCDLSLLNPITGQQIWLPLFSTFLHRSGSIKNLKRIVDLYGENDHRRGFAVSHFIIKAILKSSPDQGGAVFLLPKNSGPLAYAKPGDKTWTVVEGPKDMAHLDIICHRGRIYTALPRGGIASWDWDLDLDPSQSQSQSQQLLRLKKPTIVMENKSEYACTMPNPWLVSSPSGDLLYVASDQCYSAGALTMKVYKVDFEKRDLVKVTSLGEDAIFIVQNSTICLSVTHLPRLQRNCIYFKDEYLGLKLERPTKGEICIYNLQDRTVKFSKLGKLSTNIDPARITWFLPSLVAPSSAPHDWHN